MTDPPYTIEEFTASDGYRWRYRRYTPTHAPRGHLVGIHGIQSHAGWYEYSCTRLCQAGFVVSFLDRRGAGMNEQARGDAPSFRRLLDDVAEFLKAQPGVRKAEAAAPPLRTLLIAISWGGKLGAALQRRHPGAVDGLALLCPGFISRVRPPLWERLRIIWSRLLAPGRLFPIPLSDPALFTASSRWQQFIQEDPLSLRQATCRLLIESVRLDGYLRFVRGRVHVPILLLLAEHDRIIDNERVRSFVERFASRDREVIEYPGTHHTLEFEPGRDRIVDDLRRWAERITAS